MDILNRRCPVLPIVFAFMLVAAATSAAEVTYLGHSAWIVNTGRTLLLFDYIAEDDPATQTLRRVLDADHRSCL